MQHVTCDSCARPIPDPAEAFTIMPPRFDYVEAGDPPAVVHLCDPGCLRGWTEVTYPHRRPNFDAARARLHAPVSQLPVPATTGQRVTAAELAASTDSLDWEARALSGEVDPDSATLTEDDLFEGEPLDIAGLLRRKHATQGPNTPIGDRRNHALDCASLMGPRP